MKFKQAPKVAIDNFTDFIGKLSIKEVPNTVKVKEDKYKIIVEWNSDERTVFFGDGEWEIKETLGLYPSGSGHYTQYIKSIL